VAAIKSAEVKKLDAAKARRLFSAQPLGLEGVKDPWVCEENGVFYMLLSVAVRTPKTRDSSHATHDIFNTGECVSATGLAMSRDLDQWEWQGVVFAPGTSGWDVYCRRINSFVAQNGKWLAFYDGSASHLENYEEKTGLAVSADLRHWESLTPAGPVFTSPDASGSLRYLDAQTVGNEIHLFYEFARADGAHDLRYARLPLEALSLETARDQAYGAPTAAE
jgi:predicted GH43/DUF377 family glycosyl hydrolase